jgi:hypothetical protein
MPADMTADLLTELRKLTDFRRHPDWSKAVESVRQKRRDLFIEFEPGQFGLPEKNLAEFVDAVDWEFIHSYCIGT